MKRIEINKEISGAYSNADGLTLYFILKPYFLSHEKVEISMLGFPPMSSSFFNSSFGELIHEFGIEEFRVALKFVNISNSQIHQIKNYMNYHLT